MAARQSKAQKDTVGRVMHEYKHGELETRGRKVKNPKQAIAIALNEAGASKYRSKRANQAALKRTKTKERRGETAQAVKEGRGRKSTGSRKSTKTSKSSTRTKRASTPASSASRTSRGAQKSRSKKTAAHKSSTTRTKTTGKSTKRR
jgi:hypothetical protein